MLSEKIHGMQSKILKMIDRGNGKNHIILIHQKVFGNILENVRLEKRI